MMSGIKYSSQALKFLKSTDKVLAKRLPEKIESLQEKPVLHDTKTLEGSIETLKIIELDDIRWIPSFLFLKCNKNSAILNA